jgi:hypothetical protein
MRKNLPKLSFLPLNRTLTALRAVSNMKSNISATSKIDLGGIRVQGISAAVDMNTAKL